MKTVTYIVLLCLAFGVSGAYAQRRADQIFDTFRNEPGVTYFAFTKEMKDAFDINLEDEGKEIKGDLHEIRLLSYNPAKGKWDGDGFIKSAERMLPGSYKQLVTGSDGDDDAEIWMLGNKKKASEFHVFVKNENHEGICFLISFYGDFFMDDADGIKNIGTSLSLDL